MELINSASNITYFVPKVIEFPEHFVINTQLYDKQTLKPVPMKFFVGNSRNPIMLLQTSIDKTRYCRDDSYQFQCIQHNNEYNLQNIIQDKNDPDVFYIRQKNNVDDYYWDVPYFYKIRYNDNTKKYDILNTFNLRDISMVNGYNHKGDIKILHETDEYFVLSVVAQYGTYGTMYSGYLSSYWTAIVLLDKKSFTYTSLIHNNSHQYHFLEASNDIVYVLGCDTHYISGWRVRKCVLKLNLSSKTASMIWEESYTITDKYTFCNPVKIDDYYYELVPYLENKVYSYKLMKIKLDTATDTVTTELFNINLNGFVMDSSANKNIEYAYYVHYTMRVIKTDSNTYLFLLIHTVPNMRDVNFSYQHKHVLLKFNGTSFTVIDVVPLLDGCYGSLVNGDSKHQVWYMSNCVLFYIFDETKEKMVCTYKKPGMFMQIGFDSLNRFITQTSEKTVEILTDTNACTLQADFAEELYDKDNTSEVDTTVSFYAKNFSDEFLEVSVKLTLIGPVVFKENNSKELVISTLKTGIRTVPVIITGYGNIQVIITQNT